MRFNLMDFNAQLKTFRIVVNYFRQSTKLMHCSIYNDAIPKTDKRILRQVSECVSEKLCPQLGPVNKGDITRAKQNPKDFGPMSLWSPSINIAFPHLTPPMSAPNHRPSKRVIRG